jgi:hypothetical protein
VNAPRTTTGVTKTKPSGPGEWPSVTPVLCRYPGCREPISLAHPLPPDYLHHAICRSHIGTTEDRYSPYVEGES